MPCNSISRPLPCLGALCPLPDGVQGLGSKPVPAPKRRWCSRVRGLIALAAQRFYARNMSKDLYQSTCEAPTQSIPPNCEPNANWAHCQRLTHAPAVRPRTPLLLSSTKPRPPGAIPALTSSTCGLPHFAATMKRSVEEELDEQNLLFDEECAPDEEEAGSSEQEEQEATAQPSTRGRALEGA